MLVTSTHEPNDTKIMVFQTWNKYSERLLNAFDDEGGRWGV